VRYTASASTPLTCFEISGRYMGDIWEIYGRYGGDMGEIWGRYRGDIGEILTCFEPSA